MTTAFLDTKGLVCPLPVLRARKLLHSLNAGDVLAVEATDAGTTRDFAVFCEQTGHRLVKSAQVDGVYHFEIEKGHAPMVADRA